MWLSCIPPAAAVLLLLHIRTLAVAFVGAAGAAAISCCLMLATCCFAACCCCCCCYDQIAVFYTSAADAATGCTCNLSTAREQLLCTITRTGNTHDAGMQSSGHGRKATDQIQMEEMNSFSSPPTAVFVCFVHGECWLSGSPATKCSALQKRHKTAPIFKLSVYLVLCVLSAYYRYEYGTRLL